MQSQTKACQQPPEAGRTKEGVQPSETLISAPRTVSE